MRLWWTTRAGFWRSFRSGLGNNEMRKALILAGMLCWPAAAQWLNYPTKRTPRTADGKPNLTAPTPRRPDGKPDLTGVWMGVTKYMINKIGRASCRERV